MNKDIFLINYYKLLENVYLNKKINAIKKIIIIKIVKHMIDNFQKYIRSNIGFEIIEGSFERIEKSINDNLLLDLRIIIIIKKYYYYKNKLRNVSLDKPKNISNILILSNDYIDNKLYYNYFIEKTLGSKNITSKRNSISCNNSYLKNKYYFMKVHEYCKYNIGKNIINNVYITLKNIRKDYKAIMFLKTNTNEDISTYIILKRICDKESIPFVYLNFNENMCEEYIKNTIVALSDMINIYNR